MMFPIMQENLTYTKGRTVNWKGEVNLEQRSQTQLICFHALRQQVESTCISFTTTQVTTGERG